MTIVNRHIADETLEAAKFAASMYRYVYEEFPSAITPLATLGTAAGGAPAGATGTLNSMRTQFCSMEYHIKGAGQTKVVPLSEADGLEIALDLTDNEGAEYTFGNMANNKSVAGWKVGTDSDFFIRAKFKVADVSGTDEFAVGFRLVQAYQTAHTSYTDYSFIGIVTAANPAAVQTKTRLNSGAAATTDTLATWADGESHTLETQIVGGTSKFFFDNVQKNVGSGIAHDTGDFLMPFIYYLHATTAPGKVHLQRLECGPLSCRRPSWS